MKAKYIKPCITEDLLLSDEDLMITVSGDDTKNLVEDGGTTTGGGITEGDSRTNSVWDDGDDF